MGTDDKFSVSGWEADLADVDETRNPEDELQRSILTACEKGDLDKVQSLLKTNPELIKTTDKDKYTPLHRACYSNHIEIVKYLLKMGADVSAKTEMQWQPLHSCCQWNNFQCAALLIQNGADVNATSEGGQTPLHIAAAHGASYETVQLLIMDPFINPYLKNNNGETAAEIARRSSRFYNIFEAADPLLDFNNVKMLN